MRVCVCVCMSGRTVFIKDVREDVYVLLCLHAVGGPLDEYGQIKIKVFHDSPAAVASFLLHARQ